MLRRQRTCDDEVAMLQVTFRSLLPDERLLDIANRYYARWRDKSDHGDAAACCCITISSLHGLHDGSVRYRVVVEFSCGKRIALKAEAEASDPSVALLNSISASNLALPRYSTPRCVPTRAPASARVDGRSAS
jgi:hypothetical protein